MSERRKNIANLNGINERPQPDVEGRVPDAVIDISVIDLNARDPDLFLFYCHKRGSQSRNPSSVALKAIRKVAVLAHRIIQNLTFNALINLFIDREVFHLKKCVNKDMHIYQSIILSNISLKYF